MGIIKELKQMVQTAVRQLTAGGGQKGGGAPIDTRAPYFTRNFVAKAKSWGLTEADAADVYYHGETIKDHMMVRKYNGYEIGIYHFADPETGRTIISSIWKRDRR